MRLKDPWDNIKRSNPRGVKILEGEWGRENGAAKKIFKEIMTETS